MSEHRKHNAINYIEFPCKNPEAIKSFYSKVFGWNFQDWERITSHSVMGALKAALLQRSLSHPGGARVIFYMPRSGSYIDFSENCGRRDSQGYLCLSWRTTFPFS